MGKYFKYAIGEIILVVIGILIALQVNNWNENRKARDEERVLTESIKKDLKADVANLKYFLTIMDSTYGILKNQSKTVNRISNNLDSLIHFVKNEIYIPVYTFNGFNNNTYESMKTSGKLDVLSEAIKPSLYELSILQNTSFKEHQGFLNDYYDEIENLVRFYPIQVPFSFIKDTPQNNFIWENIDKKALVMKLNSWGTLKANLYRNTKREFNIILKKTEAVLNLLEEQND